MCDAAEHEHVIHRLIHTGENYTGVIRGYFHHGVIMNPISTKPKPMKMFA